MVAAEARARCGAVRVRRGGRAQHGTRHTTRRHRPDGVAEGLDGVAEGLDVAFAGGEHGSRVLHTALNSLRERVRAAEHAPRDRFYLLERRHGLAQIVERGVGVSAERLRVNPPHRERESILISENAPRHGDRFSQQCLGFFQAL